MVQILFSLIIGLASAAPHPANKSSVLQKLRSYKTRQIEQLARIDDQRKARINESQRISIRSAAAQLDDEKAAEELEQFSRAIDQLDDAKDEARARQELCDRLILMITNRWDGGSSLRDLLQQAASDLSKTSSDKNAGGGTDLTKFFSYLSLALRDGLDERTDRPEDVVGFVEDYIEFAGVVDPRLPTEFLKNRIYTNGYRSLPARPVSRVEAGDFTDKTMSRLEKAPPANIIQRVNIKDLVPQATN